MPMFLKNRSLPRRTFLRGLGVGLSLPLLDAMRPAIARTGGYAEFDDKSSPRRMLAICNNLGLLPDQFFPQDSGFQYQLSPYLQLLERHRQDFTVFSGVWHPDVDGGHPADICFFSTLSRSHCRAKGAYLSVRLPIARWTAHPPRSTTRHQHPQLREYCIAVASVKFRQALFLLSTQGLTFVP